MHFLLLLRFLQEAMVAPRAILSACLHAATATELVRWSNLFQSRCLESIALSHTAGAVLLRGNPRFRRRDACGVATAGPRLSHRHNLGGPFRVARSPDLLRLPRLSSQAVDGERTVQHRDR